MLSREFKAAQTGPVGVNDGIAVNRDAGSPCGPHGYVGVAEPAGDRWRGYVVTSGDLAEAETLVDVELVQLRSVGPGSPVPIVAARDAKLVVIDG